MSNLSEVRRYALEAFAKHEIIKRTTQSVTVGQPGTGIHRFTFYNLPHGTLFTGDIGDAFIPRYDLDWLKYNSGNPSYVAEKVKAISGSLEVYSKDVALAAMAYEREHYDDEDWTEELKRAWQEIQGEIMRDDFAGDRLAEVQKLYYESPLYQGEMPDFTDWSHDLCWMLEAAALLNRLDPIPAEAAA
jgi:hypothetical protein